MFVLFDVNSCLAAPQMNVMETVDDACGPFSFQTLRLAKLHATPQMIYCISKADDALLAALRAPLTPTESTTAGEPAYKVHFETRLVVW